MDKIYKLFDNEISLLKRLRLGGIIINLSNVDELYNTTLNNLIMKNFIRLHGKMNNTSLHYRITAEGSKAYKIALKLPIGG